MEEVSWTIPEALERVRAGDQTFTVFQQWVSSEEINDENVSEFVDALIAHPNNLRFIHIKHSIITDVGCSKIAEFVKQSNIIEGVCISKSPITTKTHFAFADALQVNKSLRVLKLYNEKITYDTKAANAFVAALVMNPRPAFDLRTEWILFFSRHDYGKDYEILKTQAEKLSYFPLQQSLLQLID